MRTARLLCLFLLPLLTAAALPARGNIFEIRRAYKEAGADRVALTHTDAEGKGKQTVYVGKTVLFDQNAVKAAGVVRLDATGRSVIYLVLTDAAREKFEQITRELAQERIAILVNDQIIAAPRINEPVTSGKLEISGDFDERAAQDLVIQLNAKAGGAR